MAAEPKTWSVIITKGESARRAPTRGAGQKVAHAEGSRVQVRGETRLRGQGGGREERQGEGGQ